MATMNIERGTAAHLAIEALQPHAHRPIRAFLARPGDAEEAFWTVLYGERARVDSRVAARVANELEGCRKRIQDVLDGWRPKVLREAR